MRRIVKTIEIAASAFVLACGGSDASSVASPVAKTPTVPPSDSISAAPPSGQIAFVGLGGQIEVMNADGSGVKVLTAGQASDPAWSSDGTRLAFTGDSGIFVMNADGSGVTQVTRGGSQPSWSPDGNRIAFVGSDSTGGKPTFDARIAVVAVNGSGFAWFTAGPYDQSPAWSPDGTQIAFVRVDTAGDIPSSIYVLAAAAPSNIGLRSYLAPGALCAQSAPAWSPDRKSLLFWSACPNGLPGIPFGFAIANADGSGTTTPVFSDVEETYYSKPTWSPDSKWIAFASPGFSISNLSSDIYVMSAKGATMKAIGPGGTEPAWKPAP